MAISFQFDGAAAHAELSAVLLDPGMATARAIVLVHHSTASAAKPNQPPLGKIVLHLAPEASPFQPAVAGSPAKKPSENGGDVSRVHAVPPKAAVPARYKMGDFTAALASGKVDEWLIGTGEFPGAKVA